MSHQDDYGGEAGAMLIMWTLIGLVIGGEFGFIEGFAGGAVGFLSGAFIIYMGVEGFDKLSSWKRSRN